MTFLRRIAGALGVALLLGASPIVSPVQAGYVVTLEEMGNNVVGTGSGTIDLTGLIVIFGDFSAPAYINPAVAVITTGPTDAVPIDFYTGIAGPMSFGSGSLPFPGGSASSGRGDIVGIVGALNELNVPDGYLSNNALSSNSTWLNQSFSSLGVTPGTYEWTWGTGETQDFFRLVIVSPAAVPEPASALLLGAALAGLLMAGTMRRGAVSA